MSTYRGYNIVLHQHQETWQASIVGIGFKTGLFAVKGEALEDARAFVDRIVSSRRTPR